MKKLILILLIFTLTGCGAKYELTINNDSIEENINFSLYKNGYKNNDELELNQNSDEFIDSLVASKIDAISNNYDSFYQKSVSNDGNRYDFNLYYKYMDDSFLRSRTIKECFENHDVKINGARVYIHLSGDFKCYYNDPIDINIKTTNYVKKTNGDKQGDVYHWEINQDNYHDVDILIETSDESNTRKYILYIIASIAGIAILGFLLYYGGNLLNKDDVNSI